MRLFYTFFSVAFSITNSGPDPAKSLFRGGRGEGLQPREWKRVGEINVELSTNSNCEQHYFKAAIHRAHRGFFK
jgi:hypothetical protein